MQSSQMKRRSAEGISNCLVDEKDKTWKRLQKSKGNNSSDPQKEIKKKKKNYAECKNTTVENSQPPYVLIIEKVSLKGGLYLTSIL